MSRNESLIRWTQCRINANRGPWQLSALLVIYSLYNKTYDKSTKSRSNGIRHFPTMVCHLVVVVGLMHR